MSSFNGLLLIVLIGYIVYKLRDKSLKKNQVIAVGIGIVILITLQLISKPQSPEDRIKNSPEGKMVEELTWAINSNPENYSAYVNRGYYKSEYGDYKGAIEDFNKALEIYPGYSPAYANRGATKIKSGDKEGGCADLSKATDLEFARNLLEEHCGQHY